MTISGMLLIVAVLCVVWAVASAILITAELDRRGFTTPVPFIGLFLFRNLGRYREITRHETGNTGLLFFTFVFPINIALILALVALTLGSYAV
jgi:hypothetical protein